MNNSIKPKNILVTGVTGSGKSSVAVKLKALGYNSYSIEDIKGLYKAIDKNTGQEFKGYSNNNIEKVKNLDWNVNTKALKKLLSQNKNETVYYCGTASNMDKIFKYFDKALVLIANEKNTRERLSNRKNNDFGRIEEIQNWVLTWKSWWEETMIDNGAIAINANQSINKVTESIIKATEN